MERIDAVRGNQGGDPICVMTRVRLRGPWQLVRFAWHYRRVSKTLDGVSGLMHVALAAETPLTWIMLSVWRSEESIERWAVVPEHVAAVRQTYGNAMTRESWSGRWRLEWVSSSARRWSTAPAMEGAWRDRPRRGFDPLPTAERRPA